MSETRCYTSCKGQLDDIVALRALKATKTEAESKAG
jgi:hypothetical protein